MDDLSQTNSGVGQTNPNQIQEKPDISKTTVTILVLITLMISVIGTWTVLNEISSVRTTQSGESTATGRISLTVGQSNTESSKQVDATGRVVLNLVNPK